MTKRATEAGVKTIIGLDLGIHTGWAICQGGKIVESGVQKFELGRGESPGFRFMRFRRWLEELHSLTLLANEAISLAAYERSHHRGGYTTELHVGMATRVQEWAAELKFEHAAVASTRLKKWATGKGNAGKDAMIRAASILRGPGHAELSDDEADAILVALWAWDQVARKKT